MAGGGGGGRDQRSVHQRSDQHNTQRTDPARRSLDTATLVAPRHPLRPLEANITEASRISSHVSCGDRGGSLALLGYAFTVTSNVFSK